MHRALTEFLAQPTFPEPVRRLDLALESAKLGVWDWDLRDGSVQLDRRWCEMLGLRFEDVRQELQTWEERLHPEDREQAFETVRRYLNGETSRYESLHRLRHVDGSWIHMLARGRISGWDDRGKPIRFTGTHCDVTASEQARVLMSQELGLLKELVANFPYAVALLDSDFRYVALGRRWLQDSSLDRQSLIGKSYLTQKENVPFFQLEGDWSLRLDQVLAGDSIHRVRDSYLNAQEEWVTLRWSLTPWGGSHGQPRGVMVLYENVTHFVEAEHRLQQAAKFAAIGEMAGSIAHEINTPLATISLLAGQITELLEESEGAETGENRAWVRDNAHQIEATVQRISKITRSMLSLARATQEVEPVQADLSRVVEDTLSFCSEKIRLAGVQLKVVQEERVLKARCHPAEVAQVLVNLLNNGLDSICRATLPEERAQHGIQIVLRRQENGEAEVRVSDTGPLVSEAVLPRLFHPYFTTKPVGQGTGLGLALSRRIMERQGGSLKFRQEQGTKAFVLQFPPLEPAVRTAS